MEFIIGLIIGWTIFCVLIGLFIHYFIKLIEEDLNFNIERERYNKELGYN